MAHPYREFGESSRGSFSGYTSESRKNISLPAKIKCKNCKKVKPNTSFSNKQLNDLRNHIHRYGQISIHETMVRCRNCTGGQTVELQCKYCNLWKDLELFGKAQRRNPEDAICKLCNDKNKIQDTEPVKEDEDDFGNLSDTETLPSNIYESSELDALSDDGLNSVAGNLNIHDHARPSSPASSSGGGVALDKGKQRARNTTVWVVQNRPAHQAPTTNRGQAFANDYNSSRDTSRINTVKASSATNSWTKFSSANSAASGTTNVPRPKVTAAEKHGFAKVGAYRDREAEATLLEDSCSDNDDTDDDGDSDGSVDENNPARYY